jgi:hypothetical protein
VRVATSAGTLPATFPEWQPPMSVQSAAPYFNLADGVLTYSFDLETDSAPVRISGEVKVRSVQDSGSDGCW